MCPCLNHKINSPHPSHPKPWKYWKIICSFQVGISCHFLRAAAACRVWQTAPGHVSPADVFYPNLPVMYSLALRREPPDVLRGSLRARRTLFEGFMMALAEKTGRRPSMAERSADHAMDAAESELTFGKPAFQDCIDDRTLCGTQSLRGSRSRAPGDRIKFTRART